MITPKKELHNRQASTSYKYVVRATHSTKYILKYQTDFLPYL